MPEACAKEKERDRLLDETFFFRSAVYEKKNHGSLRFPPLFSTENLRTCANFSSVDAWSTRHRNAVLSRWVPWWPPALGLVFS